MTGQTSQRLESADFELELPLRSAAARLSQRLAGDPTSIIVEGQIGSHNIGRLESLVDSISRECGLQGSLHLHAHSYSVRFSLPISGFRRTSL
jgi:hypothetical protein